jgi:uncharacterized protein Usg
MSHDSDFARRLQGERLTTAEVIYYMPDHPALLQRFLWQTLDLAPDYPRVHRFLDFWRREIDAVIHSVNVGAHGLVSPRQLGGARLDIARVVGQLN